MEDKELLRYRHEVHCYLDTLWLLAADKSKARKAWYTYLAINLNKSEDENHISKYTLNDCKQTLRLLKPKYKQITGKNNIPQSIRKNFNKTNWDKYDKNLIINSLNSYEN